MHRCRRQEALEEAIRLLERSALPQPTAGSKIIRISSAVACASEYDCHGDFLQSQIIIADEPTTAVDVTVQAQLWNCMKNITKDLNMP